MKNPILRKCNDALKNTSFLGILVYVKNLEISIVRYRVREKRGIGELEKKVQHFIERLMFLHSIGPHFSPMI